MENNYCVIMAGGIGSRFWPLSKSSMPKQFHDILGTGRTFIQMTFDRLKHICPVENFLVVTSVAYKYLVLSQLPELKEEQILLEPLRRNTAPCIAYACNRIRKKNEQANILVAPSDHLILREDEFISQVNTGLHFVEQNNVLLTMGITPSRPETGYGYIQTAEVVPSDLSDRLYHVKTFTEKPDQEMAKVFLKSGEFYWNSGIFISSLSTLQHAFERYLPEMNDLFVKGASLYGTEDEGAFINKTYSECQNISMDYGIMEKADNVCVLCADFGWSDMGTWGALYEQRPKDKGQNAISGNSVFLYATTNCIVDVPEEKIVVIQGLDNFIVVEADQTLLICRKDDEQQIRQFVNDVKLRKGTKFI